MTPVEQLEAALRTPKSSTALVAYLTAGWPTKEAFIGHLANIAQVADAVEIGVPFSDPMADGPTIQKTSQEALANGVTLAWILETLTGLEERPSAPLLLMGYLNPFLAYGLERLAVDARAAGISGFIVPDLPLDEAGSFSATMATEGMGVVQLRPPLPAARAVLMPPPGAAPDRRTAHGRSMGESYPPGGASGPLYP